MNDYLVVPKEGEPYMMRDTNVAIKDGALVFTSLDDPVGPVAFIPLASVQAVFKGKRWMQLKEEQAKDKRSEGAG